MISSYITWLKSLSLKRRYLPLVTLIGYVIFLSFIDRISSNNIKIISLLFVGFYSGPKLQAFFRFILPLLSVALVYDAIKFIGPMIRGEVHVAWPYLTEKAIFGITYQGERLTPNEYLKHFLHPALDLYTGFFYLIFIPIHVTLNAWIGYNAFRTTGDIGWPARMNWAFFWLNMMGYVTYYLFPAAPPWYVDLYGLGPANPEALPNAAGCVRFDSLIGLPIFKNFYAQSSEVFGAIPSLHVAYPALNVFFAFKFRTMRAFAVLFSVSMCFAAVYLNHHYILDVLWGLAYAIVIIAIYQRKYPNLTSS